MRTKIPSIVVFVLEAEGLGEIDGAGGTEERELMSTGQIVEAALRVRLLVTQQVILPIESEEREKQEVSSW